jgi:hypothetical protein
MVDATVGLSDWDEKKSYKVCLTLPKSGMITI